jgi:hypothetical protein
VVAERQASRSLDDLRFMHFTSHRTPGRLLRFALRCGDDELVGLLLRSLARTTHPEPDTSPAARAYARLAARIGIAPAQ